MLLIYTVWLSLLAPFAASQVPIIEPPNIKQTEQKGLQFRLREATADAAQAENREIPTSAPAVSLSEAEAAAVLRRLPKITSEASDKSEFALRPGSLPPPKTGNIIPIKFPSADQQIRVPNVSKASALEIIRFSPEGNAPLVSEMSVTFSQPMVAVASQAQAAGESVPVRLTPAGLKGKWRWLGTSTLIFDAEGRFPMATKFVATVPAGTKSAFGGGALQRDVSWSFTTPPPKVEKFAPNSQTSQTLRRDIFMAASFNQEIDENAVLQKIVVTANGKRLPIRLATGEANGSHIVVQQLGNIQPKRWMAFRTVDPLPPDSEINVTFESGLPSAEGSLTSAAPQSFSFKTYGALRLVSSHCGYDPNKTECQPSEEFRLQFNNSLYPSLQDPSQIKIEPNLENAKIYISGNAIFIQGKKKPRTTYKVTVSGAVRDFFGQTLGADVSATFNVGPEQPRLYAPGGNLVTLDPNGSPAFSVYSTNQPSLKVKIYAVAPEDYEKFRPLLRSFYSNRSVAPTPDFGKLIFDQTIETKAAPDELTETRINLAQALQGGFGHALLIADPLIKRERNDYYNFPVFVWAQATNIGVDAFVDNEQLTAFATDLKTGKPLGDAQVSLNNGAKRMSAATNESGIVNFELSDNVTRGFLLVKNGNDTAILRENNDFAEVVTDWRRKTQADALRWFVFDDRKMYRPKEEVSLKGYVRRVTGGKFSDIESLNDGQIFGGKINGLTYSVKDSRGNELGKGTAALNVFGAFDFKFKLPDNANLGYANVQIATDNGAYTITHRFQIQEFRRPEFEVSVNTETSAPFLVGNSATVNLQAKYYAGGFLSSAKTNWYVSAAPTNYTPPNRDDFIFGTFIPWWRYYEDSYRAYGATASQTFTGVTGADGKHRLAIDFISAKPARPYTLRVNGSVQDVNRQTFAASTSLLVHPSELYVGLRTPKTFVRQNESFKVETITTDIDGKTISNRDVTVKAVLKDWQQVKGTWQQVEIETQTCSVKSGSGAVSCEFTAKQGGVYTVTASVQDDRERRNESQLNVWVAGGGTAAPKRNVEQELAELVPGKKDYAPGETAEILVNSPFAPAEGVLTLRRNGVVKTERFTMNEPSTVLRIPIEERFLPNVHVQVDLVGASERTNEKGEIDKNLPKRPAFARGEINLNVSTASRKLDVSAAPAAKTLAPGGQTNINVEVRDSSGKPVASSEVAVVVVDESVLALTNYAIANPLNIFYQQIAGGTSDYHSRRDIVLGNTRDLRNGTGSGNGAGDIVSSSDASIGTSLNGQRIELLPQAMRSANASAMFIDGFSGGPLAATRPSDPDAIRQRVNFNALAIFAPSVKTDANGKAAISVKLPDNLTRYRVTAVAVDAGKRFGKGESSIAAKQPLMARPSAPRFMNFGDRIELPVVVQNQTDNPMTVDVAIRAANANLTNGNGRRVTIAPNDRVEVRFPVSAERAGIARFQIGAASGKFTDAAEIFLPVYTPATSESFATYGTTDANGAIVQPIETPRDVYSEFGGLEVTTSSTQLQQLTDAFIYLQNYPFECTEQISSRILSVAALREVLTAFDAKGLPSKTEIEAKMKSDIERIQKLQHADGGFSFWRNDDESFPFVSVHVAHALARASQKDYPVSKETIAKSLAYLKDIESRYPAFYSQESRRAISAYALYVRDMLGDKDAAKAQQLLKDATLEKLSPESIGWILSVLADDKNSTEQVNLIKRHLLNRVTETAGAAHFVTKYTDGEYVLLSSERRADGVILEALLKAEPSNALVPKIVRGLLAAKTKGRWSSTQENVFILLALDKYFEVYEKVTPNFVARVWLGQDFAGRQDFKGRSTDSNLINVPMSYLGQQKGESNLILDKQGAGRLYYRIGLNYAPKNLKLDAADYGFTVIRTYEAVDAPGDVRQTADGSWTIKSGARVRVKLQMVAPTRRYHVALADRLPAGLEIINPSLAVSEALPVKAKENQTVSDYRSRFIWFSHQNLRDERAEAFTSLLPEGVWNYSYVARATTPGNFVVPPAKAEEMYQPETFGRSGTDFVKVE